MSFGSGALTGVGVVLSLMVSVGLLMGALWIGATVVGLGPWTVQDYLLAAAAVVAVSIVTTLVCAAAGDAAFFFWLLGHIAAIDTLAATLGVSKVSAALMWLCVLVLSFVLGLAAGALMSAGTPVRPEVYGPTVVDQDFTSPALRAYDHWR